MVLLVHGGPWAPRRLGLQPATPVARQPRLCGAVGQLPRLDRLRQGLRQRRQPGVGPEDARRPDRRRRLGGRATASPRRTRSRSWAAATAATRRSSGSTFTPDEFACGVDIVGPSNLDTLLKTIPPYWEADHASSSTSAWATRRPTRASALLKAALAAHLRRQDQEAAADRPGRQRPAREAGREPTRSSTAMKAKNIPVTYVAVPRRGPRLRPAGEQHRLQRGRRGLPRDRASAAAPSRSATTSRARRSRCWTAPTSCTD